MFELQKQDNLRIVEINNYSFNLKIQIKAKSEKKARNIACDFWKNKTTIKEKTTFTAYKLEAIVEIPDTL